MPRAPPPLRALLPILLLAGCVAPDAAPAPATPDAPAGQPRIVPVTLEDCLVVEALTTVPAEVARRHVPEAFEPAEQASGRVAVALGGFSCAEGDASGLLAIAVRPLHDALRDDAVDRHFWRPEVHLPPGAALTEAYRALGALAIPAVVRGEAGPAGGSFVIEADEGWTHRITFGGAPLAPSAEALTQGVFREYSAAEGGFAFLQATFVPPPGPGFALLPATVETGEGTVARELLGPSIQAPAFVLRDAAYGDAMLGFVPHAER